MAAAAVAACAVTRKDAGGEDNSIAIESSNYEFVSPPDPDPEPA